MCEAAEKRFADRIEDLEAKLEKRLLQKLAHLDGSTTCPGASDSEQASSPPVATAPLPVLEEDDDVSSQSDSAFPPSYDAFG